FFFFSSRRRHTRSDRDWSSDVCSSDLLEGYDRDVRTGVRGRILRGRDLQAKAEESAAGRLSIPCWRCGGQLELKRGPGRFAGEGPGRPRVSHVPSVWQEIDFLVPAKFFDLQRSRLAGSRNGDGGRFWG